MIFTTEILGKTCPFREIPVRQQGRGQTGRGFYGKTVWKGWAGTIVVALTVFITT